MSPFARETASRESACLACGGEVVWVAPGDHVAAPRETGLDRIETVIDVSRALNERDREAFLTSLDPHVEWRPATIELVGDRPYRGREDVGQWLDFVERSWNGFHWDWTDVRIRESTVAVLGTITAHAGEREGFRERVGWLWRLRERSVVSMHATTDAERILAELEKA